MRRSVWSRNLKNEEAKAGVGPQGHKKNIVLLLTGINYYTGWLKKLIQRTCTSCRRYGLNSKRRHNTRHTVGCGNPSSLFALRVDLRGLSFKTLLNSSHVLLWYTWSAGAFAYTQTAYFPKLAIPTTNYLPRWRLNVETKTKRTLHGSWRLGFNELTNAKKILCCIVAILLSTDAAARRAL